VTDENAHPDFEAIMSRFSTTNPRKVESLRKSHPVQYAVFDILRIQGEDVTSLPLWKRKELLEEVIEENERISKVRYVEGQGDALFALVCEQGLEGVVLKWKDSIYEVGKRSKHWLKVINYSYYEVYLTGIRKGEVGYLLSFPDGKPAGIMEFPLPPDARKALWGILPMAKQKEDERFIYLKPEIRCQVKSRGLTKQGYIRIPVFQKFLFT
jgi:DNA ligase-1